LTFSHPRTRSPVATCSVRANPHRQDGSVHAADADDAGKRPRPRRAAARSAERRV